MSSTSQVPAVLTSAVLDRSFSVQQLKNNRAAIKQLLEEVLVRGIDRDYAAIPGTGKWKDGKEQEGKLTLLKPGAEKICSLFGIAVEPIVDAIRDGEDVTFRVTCRMTSIASGVYLGSGIGEASTLESKYAWKAAICDEQFENEDPHRRRIHYGKVWENREQVIRAVRQVRENPNDKMNTVLKMAKKRAMIDGVLTVTAASDTFTQDLEDRTETSGQRASAPVSGAQVQAARQTDEPAITADQSKRFYGIWKNTPGRTKEIVQEYLRIHCGGITDDRKMPARMYDAACAWAKSGQPIPVAPAPAEKKAAPPAAAQPQQAPESEEMRAVKELFGYTGHDLAEQAALLDKYKDNLKELVDYLKDDLNSDREA